MKSKVLIIIPCYNEEKTIRDIILQLKKFKIIIINDNSTDNSEKILKKMKINFISHKRNLGYDQAIFTGVKEAVKKNYDIICTFDADGQHNNLDLERMLKFFFKENLDLLIGKRKKILRFSEKLFNFYTKRKYGVSDIFCGLKIYRLKECIKYLNDFEKNNLGINVALKLLKKSIKYDEISLNDNSRFDEPRIGSNLKVNLINIKRLFREIFL